MWGKDRSLRSKGVRHPGMLFTLDEDHPVEAPKHRELFGPEKALLRRPSS
jgi:hypothetical protein